MYFLKQYKDKSSTNKNDSLVPEGKNREKGIKMETKPLWMNSPCITVFTLEPHEITKGKNTTLKSLQETETNEQ